jgi:hypothetical protein
MREHLSTILLGPAKNLLADSSSPTLPHYVNSSTIAVRVRHRGDGHQAVTGSSREMERGNPVLSPHLWTSMFVELTRKWMGQKAGAVFAGMHKAIDGSPYGSISFSACPNGTARSLPVGTGTCGENSGTPFV